MRKTIVFGIFVFTALFTFKACKQTPKKEITTKGYIVESKTTTINWTAYKTTSKTPVKGVFTKVNLENAKHGKTAFEALNGLKFSIPVSSIFTKDTIRDNKLKKFFFGVMDNTKLLSGTINMNNETSGTVDLTMNGVTQTLPITYVISDQMVTMEALMDVDNWNAQNALTSLNKACKELHTGEDGITKTWSEVKIDIATYLKHE